MKKIIYFSLFCLLLSNCIREDPDECFADLRLQFQLAGKFKRFDDDVRNDIHLHIFRESANHTSMIIPYKELDNKGEFRMRKELAGSIHFVAWSVPYDDNEALRIPTCSPGELLSEKKIEMNLKSDMSCESMGDLYMGVYNYYEDDLQSESLHTIEVQNIICRVTVTVLGYEETDTGLQDNRSVSLQKYIPDMIEITGFKREMNAAKEGVGDDAVHYSALEYDPEANGLKTGVIGLLPSEEKQSLQVVVYGNGEPLLKVVTEERSVPGDRLDLIISNNMEVELYVNGWRSKNVQVEWM